MNSSNGYYPDALHIVIILDCHPDWINYRVHLKLDKDQIVQHHIL